MMMKKSLGTLCAGMALWIGQGAPATAAPRADLAPAGVTASGGASVFDREFGDEFLDQYWRLHPDEAIAAGYYATAAALRVPDAGARQELVQFLESSLARLRRLPAQALDARAASDRLVLENQLRSELWSIRELRSWEWDPSNYNIAPTIGLLLETPYAPLDERLRAISARLARAADYYAAARAAVAHPTREHTRLAIEQNSGALELLGAALDQQVTASGLDAVEKAQFARNAAGARQAIQDYVDWLRGLDAPAPPAATGAAGSAPMPWRSFRLGARLYEQKFGFDIANGGSAAALYQRALAEKERLLLRMDLLADELWPKVFPDAVRPTDRLEKIGRVIDKLSEQHVAPADLYEEIRRRIPELTRFVQEHDLLTLDLEKPLEVRVTPAYERGVAGAGIDAPGPYNPGAATYFNVDPIEQLPAERAESYLREYNRWMMPVFVIHEAIPGHYVQLVYANKSPSRIKSIFSNGAMVEGWAVYGERMMLEAGFGDDTAEQWLIYSKWNLRSVVNTILDYSVHVKGMDEAEALRLLTREAFQSEEEARTKWRRVTLTSVQLTSYFAGYSAIYDLRERLKATLGPRFSLKRFHERFLGYGSAPVQVIEQMIDKDGL